MDTGNGNMADMSKMGSMLDNLKAMIDFPATKERIVEEANKMEGMADEHKSWLKDNLPEGMYNTMEEVKDALGM
ncbi:DUF2795 domain-containing protein [Candidatus Microgenomates bacterium]|jgi:hypothetical protein|nr:MAG: DUF2795 domain-containing protein [Candidatus Microgenomates bacterium]